MTTTLNNSYQSSPLTISQGGTSVASFTAYNLIAAGTTSTGALQSAGTGSSGQIYKSGGNAALGTWVNQNTLGGWVLLATISASASANISLTGLTTTYAAYKVSVAALIPATNATNLQLLVSSNNGTSYDTGSGNYSYQNIYINDSGAAAANTHGSTGTTSMQLGNVWSNTSFANNFEVTLYNPAQSTANNGFTWIGKYNDSTSGSSVFQGGSRRLATQVNTAIRFQMSSGNIASGTFKLYGLLA